MASVRYLSKTKAFLSICHIHTNTRKYNGIGHKFNLSHVENLSLFDLKKTAYLASSLSERLDGASS